MLVIQQITVTSSRASRGAPGATRRNALPRAFPLIPSARAYVYQRHALHEREADYEHRLVEEHTSDRLPRTVRELGVELDGDLLVVHVHWTTETGAPHRRNVERALVLQLGEIGRITTNGRHTGAHAMVYTRSTYNVACVETLEETLFTERAPDRDFRFEADVL